jgi:copper homeostasis protein
MMSSNPSSFLFEVCANSAASAIAAQEGGALRVELCDNLYEGGTTPSAGCIALTRKSISIGLNVIIRPRGGDFLYTDLEFEIMKYDVKCAKDLGVDGIVIGVLLPDGSVDRQRTEELAHLAQPLSVTFHRAFDVTRDPCQALRDIIETGCNRILTSGQANKAAEGAELIAELVKKAGKRITILVGSGVNEENIAELIRTTRAWEYHGSAQKRIASAMQYRHPQVSMGGVPQIPEFEIAVTSAERVKRIVEIGQSAFRELR